MKDEATTTTVDDRREAVAPRRMGQVGRAEALRLLGSVSLGRIVFTHQALPAVRPVNHLMDGEDIIVQLHDGATLASIVAPTQATGVVVAYEADVIDPETHIGWSVVVTGYAHRVTDEGGTRALRRPTAPVGGTPRHEYRVAYPAGPGDGLAAHRIGACRSRRTTVKLRRWTSRRDRAPAPRRPLERRWGRRHATVPALHRIGCAPAVTPKVTHRGRRREARATPAGCRPRPGARSPGCRPRCGPAPRGCSGRCVCRRWGFRGRCP